MRILKPLLIRIKTHLDKTTNVTRENLTGVRVVRAFNKQAHETEKFKHANYDLISTQIKISHQLSLNHLVLSILATVLN